ncbi:MAG: phosphoadenylyl-sulfate reductase [Mobilicoccus sp.]|nr:phosphoadenylyl-sulfate reductase [Mobilicoccus sp.]
MTTDTLRGPEELAELAAAASSRLAGAPAEDVIAWAAEEFGERWAITASMQDTVLAHLVQTVAPGTTALFLDTGYHFPETLATRDRVVAEYALTVRSLTPDQSTAEQDETYGRDLFGSDPDLCCLLRKEMPLAGALVDYEAWATGLRRAESITRADATEVSFDERRGLVRIAPLVAWSNDDVARYSAEHDTIANPLLLDGYPSIGCAPCTRRVAPGEDPRAGRWAGSDKTECGINT